MIVSILQKMGFSKGKPAPSRAGTPAPEKPAKIDSPAAVPAGGGRSRPTGTLGAEVKPEMDAATKPRTRPRKKALAQDVGLVKADPGDARSGDTPAAAVAPVSLVSAKTSAKSAKRPKATSVASGKVQVPIHAVPLPAPEPLPVIPIPTPETSEASEMPETFDLPGAVPVSLPTPPKIMATSVVSAGVPVRAGRPPSKLAQLTVPSMAQTVASTAAKASYTQSLPTSVPAPMTPSTVKKDPNLANNWKTKPLTELTDAELIAMPDSEYMNATQLAVFRQKLTNLKIDILSSAGETTEHLREDSSVVPDPADRATIEEEHALELRTRDRERKLLKKIEQSIARIDAGDYGYCDETGEPIGVGRLLARPTATLSLEAQQRRELKQKMFGD